MVYIKTQVVCRIVGESDKYSSTYGGFMVADDATVKDIAEAFIDHKELLTRKNPQLDIKEISILDINLEV